MGALTPPPFTSQLIRGYFIQRRRNRNSSPWCFLHDITITACVWIFEEEPRLSHLKIESYKKEVARKNHGLLYVSLFFIYLAFTRFESK